MNYGIAYILQVYIWFFPSSSGYYSCTHLIILYYFIIPTWRCVSYDVIHNFKWVKMILIKMEINGFEILLIDVTF